MGGGSDIEETANRTGLPVELIQESEGFREYDGVYLDNVIPVSVFADMLTQWRVGMNGATGLDFGVLPTIPAIRRIKDDDEYDDVFECLRIMESAALKEMRSNAER